MKKLKCLLAILLVAIISTGCVKYNAHMSIKKDKSMDFTIIYALDKTMMGEMASLKEEDFSDLKKDGYTIEKYTEGNYEGFKITKKIANIDDISTDKDVEFNLSGMMEEDENNKYMFKVVKDGSKSTYYAKFKFDSNDSGLNEDEEEVLPDEKSEEVGTAGSTLVEPKEDESLIAPNDEDDDDDLISGNDIDLSGLTGSMDLSFKVSLPNGAISSNATTKENNNKDLTWKLNYSGAQTIEFAFEIDANAKDSNMLLYIGIGVGVLVLIAIVVVVITSSKKKKAPVVAAPAQEEPKEVTENKE